MSTSDAILQELFRSVRGKEKKKKKRHGPSEEREEGSRRHGRSRHEDEDRRRPKSSRHSSSSFFMGGSSGGSSKRGRESHEERPPVRNREEDVFWDSRWDAIQLQKKAEDQERKGRHYLDDRRRESRYKVPKKRERRERSSSPECDELKRLRKYKEIQDLVVKEDQRFVDKPPDPSLFEWDDLTKMWRRKVPKKEKLESKSSVQKGRRDGVQVPPQHEDEDEKEEGELRSEEESSVTESHRSRRREDEKRRTHRRPRSSSSRSRHLVKRSASRHSRRSPHSRHSHRRVDNPRHRRRSHSKERDNYFRSSRSAIDKEKLLAIAKKNAVRLLSSNNLMGMDHNRLVAIKSGGQSLSQLTEFCRELAKKGITDEFSDGDVLKNSDSEGESQVHHPFMIKDRPLPNPFGVASSSSGTETLTPAAKMAAKSHRMLEFPVSSGNAHRVKEESSEGPKEEEEEEEDDKKDDSNNKEKSQERETLAPPVSPPEEIPPSSSDNSKEEVCEGTSVVSPDAAATPTSEGEEALPNENKNESAPDTVFEECKNSDSPVMDIGSIVSQRLNAMRKLSENPHDPEALEEMNLVEKEMSNWATSKNRPGQFTGHTGAKVLSKGELCTGIQAWARQEQFSTAQKVSGGFGEFMLRKMGWNEGEGLGKDKSGDVDPLTLDIKMDKKGLMSVEEGLYKRKKGSVLTMTACKDISCKHPVSALMELATKRRWGPPNFVQAFECGPPHKKQYIYKVTVNGVEYQPTIACENKKKAKSDAATFALQEMGLLAKDPNNPL